MKRDQQTNENHSSRRTFLRRSSIMMAGVPFLNLNTRFSEYGGILSFDEDPITRNEPITVLSEQRLQFEYGEERMILDDDLQPYMLITKEGTIILQAYNHKEPLPQERICYPHFMDTVISRDKGNTWVKFLMRPGKNDINIEGGIIQLKDGTILMLETYVTPGEKSNTGESLMFYSNDDMKSIAGPLTITFDIPDADFYATSDDVGRPHAAMRLHRRIIEMPNGDLVTTMYGWKKGDRNPADYQVHMMKSRVFVFRSSNKGRHWRYVSEITTFPMTQTEGFTEPVLNRVTKGKHAGRLICLLRTGRELYRTHSDNEGKTWSQPLPLIFADRDVYATEKWRDMFKDVERNGQSVTKSSIELVGAVVDPDLCMLRSGLLVAAFGIRIPGKACFQKWQHPWNGNYIAVSGDGGDTWDNVQQLTSGIPTTHYMAVEEMREDNKMFVVYDWGSWGNWNGKKGRPYVYGRSVTIKENS